jgi:hypothetical protein
MKEYNTFDLFDDICESLIGFEVFKNETVLFHVKIELELPKNIVEKIKNDLSYIPDIDLKDIKYRGFKIVINEIPIPRK